MENGTLQKIQRYELRPCTVKDFKNDYEQDVFNAFRHVNVNCIDDPE